MRGGNVPVRYLPSLVDVRTKVGDCLRLLESRCKFEVGRRGIDRIGIQNYQPIHLAGVEIRNQCFHVGNLVTRERN